MRFSTCFCVVCYVSVIAEYFNESLRIVEGKKLREWLESSREDQNSTILHMCRDICDTASGTGEEGEFDFAVFF